MSVVLWAHKYDMRFNEFRSGLYTFLAQVRVMCGTTPTIAKTTLEAESQTQARAILCHLYGKANVLSVVQELSEDGLKVPSPEEQRAKSLKDQSKRLAQQAKQVKAQDAVRKAQTRLYKVITR
jgi:hypothetical protein